LASVTFDRVDKIFGDGTRAVSELTLDVADGEFMVLVGPSGCGKTTALRMVAGLEDASEGEIRIGDRIVNDVGPRRRDVAMVFQNYALYPHMDVFENMAFGLRSRKVPKADVRRRVEDAARVLGLAEHLKRRPGQLSGGQRQRVAMGRAIVREPQAFLMDEPLSNLDAKLRVQMRVEIARLQRDLDATTLYVTHDQVEAMTMGDRVAVMRRGELQQCEAPQQLYDRPTNLFVASFIGSPAMNLVQAEIRADGDGLLCRAAGSELRLRGELSALRLYAGRKVALGVRPEHVRRADGEGGLRLTGTVVLTESLGSTLLVHADVEGAPVTTSEVLEGLVGGDPSDAVQLQGGHGSVRVIGSFEPDGAVRQGETVELALDPRRLHFFDLETGHAIR
jgi:multiple sugar transport system ATP-binding protein